MKISIRQGGKQGDAYGRKVLYTFLASTEREIEIALKEQLKLKSAVAWQGVIAHHSATTDGRMFDEQGITRYHLSFRYNGDTVTEAKAKELQLQGKVVVLPWKDVGYNFLVEQAEDGYVVWLGRSLDVAGAHCSEEGMNKTRIGICFVGNYDKAVPSKEVYAIGQALISVLADKFSFAGLMVGPHSKYAPKTCPGKLFAMNAVMPLPLAK